MTSIYAKYQQILQYESLEEFISLDHESLNLGPESKANLNLSVVKTRLGETPYMQETGVWSFT